MDSVIDFFTGLILALLTLDTFRAVLAMIGWINPDWKYAWIVYGRGSKNMVKGALKELGFSDSESQQIKRNLSSVSENFKHRYGITKENAIKHLIIILAKYIVKFDNPIQYGGNKTTKSRFYIDTMEAAHNQEDTIALSSIMVNLINEKTANSDAPNIIISPKGGNPIFSKEVADHYKACFLVAKSNNDKSRITSSSYPSDALFKINYEGSWGIKNGTGTKSILLDCNASGASQLFEIVNDLEKSPDSIPFKTPSEVYVLFRPDCNDNIDKKFKDSGCEFFRYFDLNEDIKEDLYNLNMFCSREGHEFNIYLDEVNSKIETIINNLKEENLLKY